MYKFLFILFLLSSGEYWELLAMLTVACVWKDRNKTALNFLLDDLCLPVLQYILSHTLPPPKQFATLSAGTNSFGIPCYNWVNIKPNHRPFQHRRHLLNNDRFVLNKLHLCICSYGQGRLSLASTLFSFSRWGAREQAAEIAGRLHRPVSLKCSPCELGYIVEDRGALSVCTWVSMSVSVSASVYALYVFLCLQVCLCQIRQEQSSKDRECVCVCVCV